MAESMEKVAKKAVNKCKEDLGIPFGQSNKEKKPSKKPEKKPKKDDDDPSPQLPTDTTDKPSRQRGKLQTGRRTRTGRAAKPEVAKPPQKIQEELVLHI